MLNAISVLWFVECYIIWGCEAASGKIWGEGSWGGEGGILGWANWCPCQAQNIVKGKREPQDGWRGPEQSSGIGGKRCRKENTGVRLPRLHQINPGEENHRRWLDFETCRENWELGADGWSPICWPSATVKGANAKEMDRNHIKKGDEWEVVENLVF